MALPGRWLPLGVAACAVGLSLAGCGQGPTLQASAEPASSSPTSTAASVETAAVRPKQAFRRQALAMGTLRADPDSGCLWIEHNGEATSELLLDGEEHRVDFSVSPPTVWEGDRMVATVGTEVRFGGGYTDRESGVRGCPVSGEGIFFGGFSQQ